MEWNIKLDDKQLETVLAGLGELPAKASFHLLIALDQQIAAQRQAASLGSVTQFPSSAVQEASKS